MPLRIITGTPGAGKTAMAVADLMKSPYKDRPLFVMGVPELKLDHEKAPAVKEWTRLVPNEEDASLLEPEFTFPPESIILIDEAQKVFRPRASGSRVPDHVAAMEKHRHGGIEFWLLTQNPRLLDANIRDLCTCHIHIRNTALGRWRYEWPEIADPKSKADREISSNGRYKLPKEAFSQYRSAKLHIDQKLSIPNAAKVLMVVVVALAGLAWYGYGRVQEFKQTTLHGGDPLASKDGKGAVKPLPPPVDPKVAYLQALEPRVGDLQHTAPAYDALTRAQTVPVPAACISSKTRCTCYTHQATKYSIAEAECRQIVESGMYLAFDPAGQRQKDQQVQRQQDQAQQVRSQSKGLPESDLYIGVQSPPGSVLTYDKAQASPGRSQGQDQGYQRLPVLAQGSGSPSL